MTARGGVGQGEGRAVVPGGPLVHEPVTGGVAGLAEDYVEGGVVEVGEVGGEALGGAEVAADLFDGGGVAGLGLSAGSGGDADDGGDKGGEVEERILDVDGVERAVLPFGEASGGVGFDEAVLYGGG